MAKERKMSWGGRDKVPMPLYPIDSQRRKVHSAQWDTAHFQDDNLRMSTIDARNFANEVIKTTWFKNRFKLIVPESVLEYVGVYPHYRDQEEISRSGGYNRNKKGLVEYTGWADVPWRDFNQMGVLHGLAHITRKRDLRNAMHGRRFCHFYLELVKHFLGKEDYKDLKDAFRKRNIKFSPVDTQEITLTMGNKTKIQARMRLDEDLQEFRKALKKEGYREMKVKD